MLKTAFITGADRGLGQAVSAQLLRSGWRVFAGQYLPGWHELGDLLEKYPDLLKIVPLDVSSIESVRKAAEMTGQHTDNLDLLINNAGVTSPTMHRDIREPQDYAEMLRLFEVNALGPLRVVEALLPLLDQGEMKRLCFVSSEAGSITRNYRKSWFGYNMSKAALNMAVSIFFNRLREEGFTFRVYHPGWIRSYMGGTKNLEADLEPEEAAAYALDYFLNDLPLEEEDHLVMRDYQGNEWPW
jgi:NAD(P)-dependent dehydrogenase (short-subunit alcohol dehydrogenase family)